MAWTTVSMDGPDLHWTALLPGTYAARACRITVASTQPVTLAVGPECSDLSAPSGRVIPTWYAFGDTIEEAEASGWIPASELPGLTFPTLFDQPAPEGRTITIWCKIKTDAAPAEDGFRSSFELTICPSP